MGRNEICFSHEEHAAADQPGRFTMYRYVTSYHGSGWFPDCYLTECRPPNPPMVHYNSHTIERGRERIFSLNRFDDRLDHLLFPRLESVIGSSESRVFATWHRLDDDDGTFIRVVPQLWIHRREIGTVVVDQLEGQHVAPDGQVHDVRCITFLAPHMTPHDNRFREPGVMHITLDEFERLADMNSHARYDEMYPRAG